MNTCDLEIYQGDDWAAWVTVLNCSDGLPADLSQYSAAQAQIRTAPADQSRHVAAEFTATVCIPNNISLYLTSAQTRTLRGLFYCWDLQLITPDNMIVTIMRGNVNVTAEVTREGEIPWDATPISPLLWHPESPFRVQWGQSVLLGR